MRPLEHVPASAAHVGYDKLAADLTVNDVLALPEVACWSDPDACRQAARLALTEARRNSWDTHDPSWARPKTWSCTHRQPPVQVRYVVDCDGTVWQRHPNERDVYETLPVDAWSPRRHDRTPRNARAYPWG